MKTALWIALALAASLFAGGCASVPALTSVPPNYTLPRDGGKGVAVLSTTLTGVTTEAIPHLYVRGLTTDFHSSIPMWDGKFIETGQQYIPAKTGSNLILAQIPSEQPVGILHVVELPAGTYEIYAFGGSSGTGYVKSTRPFSCPFTVEAGQVIYVGNFNIDHHPYDAMQRSTFTVSNMQERDLVLLKTRHPQLAQESIYIGIEKEEPSGE